jgi:UDP-glucose 4-epimerase
VVVLDDFSSGKMTAIDGLVGSDCLKVVKGDVRDCKVLNGVLAGVDAVVHLAALVDPADSVLRPLVFHDVNATGTLNVLNACVEKRVDKFVFASSAAVYGDGNLLPLREDCELRPISPYAASKVSGEYYCRTFSKCYGLGTVILRFFNVYGPGQGVNQYAGVITRFVQSGLHDEPLRVNGDGMQTRDFINVEDVVEMVLRVLDHEPMDGGVFNVCTGTSMSINDLAQVVCETLGKDLGILHVASREGDLLHSYGDPDKAEKILGFRAHVDFKKGLRRFVDSFSTT